MKGRVEKRNYAPVAALKGAIPGHQNQEGGLPTFPKKRKKKKNIKKKQINSEDGRVLNI